MRKRWGKILAGAALAGVAVALVWGRPLADRLRGRALSGEEARLWLVEVFGERLIERGIEPLQGFHTYGDGLNEWILVRMPAERFDEFKASAIAAVRRRAEFRVEESGSMPAGGNPGGETPPAWWRPNALPDAEVVNVRFQGGGHWLVFSRKRGEVYVYVWSS